MFGGEREILLLTKGKKLNKVKSPIYLCYEEIVYCYKIFMQFNFDKLKQWCVE